MSKKPFIIGIIAVALIAIVFFMRGVTPLPFLAKSPNFVGPPAVEVSYHTTPAYGATAVEYGLMVALIAAVIIGAVTVVGERTNQAFITTGNALPQVPVTP